MAYTPNYQLQNPTPGDPAVKNTWGTIENTGRSLVDTALGGTLSLSVAGSANVVLTSSAGAPDQSRYMHYIFTGALTGNVVVLWPLSLGRSFSVINSTTGAFTLSCGADNGSGSAAGTTISVPSGATLFLYSDGTNVNYRLGYTNIPNISIGSSAGGGFVSILNTGNSVSYYSNGSGQPNDHSWQHLVGQIDSAGDGVIIYGNGDIINQNNSYGAISMREWKQDFKPARSQWDDVKALGQSAERYRMKAHVQEFGDESPFHLGLVTDRTKEICPKLVHTGVDGTEHIIYSAAYMKNLVATSEAQIRIEALESSVSELRNEIKRLRGEV